MPDQLVTSDDVNLQTLTHELPATAISWWEKNQSAIQVCTTAQAAINQFFVSSALCRHQMCGTSLIPQWELDQILRLQLLLALLDTLKTLDNPLPNAEQINSIYQQSDNQEKIVILKGLSLLPAAAELVGMSIHACRTHDTHVLAALALNNPYPAHYYSEQVFNQLILKALFADMDISQTLWLGSRLNPALSHLCKDLVEERLLAQRMPPRTIWMAMRLADLADDFAVTYQRFTQDNDRSQRYFSLLALTHNGLPPHLNDLRQSLLNGLSQEPDATLLTLKQHIINHHTANHTGT